MPNSDKEEKKNKPMPIGVWIGLAVAAVVIFVLGNVLG